jgi:hypothetical protein
LEQRVAAVERQMAAVERQMTAVGTKVDRMMAMLTALRPAAPAEDGHNGNAAV